jgi:hypothetical protein
LCFDRVAESGGEEIWLWFIGLAALVIGIIAVAVPVLRVCVDYLFGLF